MLIRPIDADFYEILKNSPVYETVDGRIFNTDRPEIDFKEDRIPYIIFSYVQGAPSGSTKDDIMEPVDNVTVSISCVAKKREELAELIDAVHTAIAEAVNNGAGDFCSVTPSVSPVEYDYLKPCFEQVLTYRCDLYV